MKLYFLLLISITTSVSPNLPQHMTAHSVGVHPSQVIWANLRIGWREMVIRNSVICVLLVVLLVALLVPATFLTLIGEPASSVPLFPFLRFMAEMSPEAHGVLSALVAPGAISILKDILPVICRCEFSLFHLTHFYLHHLVFV